MTLGSKVKWSDILKISFQLATQILITVLFSEVLPFLYNGGPLCQRSISYIFIIRLFVLNSNSFYFLNGVYSYFTQCFPEDKSFQYNIEDIGQGQKWHTLRYLMSARIFATGL